MADSQGLVAEDTLQLVDLSDVKRLLDVGGGTGVRLMGWGMPMQTTAVILSGPKDLGLGSLGLVDPTVDDPVVEIAHSGIFTGPEKLFWSGNMPPFPGMGYPLVPGYEACGEMVEAAPETGFKVGDYVFVHLGQIVLQPTRVVRYAGCLAGRLRGW